MDADYGEHTGRLGRLGSDYLNATHLPNTFSPFRQPGRIPGQPTYILGAEALTHDPRYRGSFLF
jgi:hypothetical protein